MKIREVMTDKVIKIRPEESVSVAARTLTHYNIGILPVCGSGDKVCGMITDRDIVTRCLAANRVPEDTAVKEIMTGRVLSVSPDTDVGVATHLMGREQVRRLAVMEQGRLCGMVSLGDIANREDTAYDAADALTEISSNISER